MNFSQPLLQDGDTSAQSITPKVDINVTTTNSPFTKNFKSQISTSSTDLNPQFCNYDEKEEATCITQLTYL
jgi:hypothetical protein